MRKIDVRDDSIGNNLSILHFNFIKCILTSRREKKIFCVVPRSRSSLQN